MSFSTDTSQSVFYFKMQKSYDKNIKTHRVSYSSGTSWRQAFLMYDNPLHRKKEKFIYDRSTTVSPIYENILVNIHSGLKFKKKLVNRWMFGHKFGEFVWNRKLALYKAKQLKKKKKK
jgi:ribosomal protein S19